MRHPLVCFPSHPCLPRLFIAVLFDTVGVADGLFSVQVNTEYMI